MHYPGIVIYAVNYIIVLDNLKSHKVEDVKVEAKRVAIGFVFLSPYSPDLNPIECMWKSIRKVTSTPFVRHMDDMRNTVKEAFYRLTKKLGSLPLGLANFLLRVSIILIFVDDYKCLSPFTLYYHEEAL
jgi:putative transposase